jgi:hypothetical protein
MASVTFAPSKLHNQDQDAATSTEPFIALNPDKLVNTLMGGSIVDLIANTLMVKFTAHNKVEAANILMDKFIAQPSARPAITSTAAFTAVLTVNISTAQFTARLAAWQLQLVQLDPQRLRAVADSSNRYRPPNLANPRQPRVLRVTLG